MALDFGFVGSCRGAMSNDVGKGMAGQGCLVLLTFCWWPRMWPMAVAKALGKCLWRSSVVSPGNEVKWPFLIARMTVEG